MSGFSEFVSKQTRDVADGKPYDRAVLRAIVDFLRSDEPLSLEDRRQMATHLHVLFLKQSPQELRNARRQMDWAVYENTRELLIAKFVAEGSASPVSDAEAATAIKFGFPSNEAFQKWMRRYAPSTRADKKN